MPVATKSRKPVAKHASPIKMTSGWKTRQSGGVRILQSGTLARQSWLTHGFSTRLGGVSTLGRDKTSLNLGFTEWDTRENVEANRAMFIRALSKGDWRIVTLKQIHSDVVHVIEAAHIGPLRGDALVTSAPGLLLAVQTADCVPILLADTRRRVVAAVHAGWRGTLARIVSKTIGRMRMSFGSVPHDVVAALGPSIGRCSYEVGPEVAQAFAAQFSEAPAWFDGPFDRLAAGEEPNPLKWLSMTPPGHDPPPPRVQLDLIAANRWQLEDAGVPASQIVSSDLCTACRNDLLFSYRRENGRTGRMMSVIGIHQE